MATLFIKLGNTFVPIPTIKGSDGITPHIGVNGNWWIGTTDTGVPASGTVDLQNSTVTFSQATTKANVVSGETVPILLGKIMKWFSSFGSLAWLSSLSYSDVGAEASGAVASHNASVSAHSDIRALAEGRYNALVFDNLAQLTAWIAGTYTRSDSKVVANLTVGQNIYLRNQTESDYWVDSLPVTAVSDLTVLPTDKVDLVDYLTKVGDASSTTGVFTEAGTRANILSGETIAILLGKIKKYFTDLKTVAFTGSYSDLSDKPTIPTVTNDFTNDYKGYIDFLTGRNDVTTLASLPVTKRAILATMTAGSTLSLAAALTDGKELFVKCYNSSASAITLTLPTSGGFESKKPNTTTDVASISLAAGCKVEISIIAINSVYYIKTDA